MSEYVKGPWIMEPTRGGDKEIFINAHGDGWHRLECTVSRDDCDDETAEACARLIVAAPELLEALKDLEWHDGGACPQCCATQGEPHQTKCILGNAIAKAEGK